MNKQELANAVADTAGITKSFSKDLVDVVIAELVKGIMESDKTYIPSLGIFTKVHKEPRQGRNPKTGESVQIPAKTVIKYKTSIVIE